MANDNQKVLNYMKNIEEYFRNFKSYKATAGMLDDASEENKKKALWNEYGTHNILKYDSVAIENQGLKPLTKNTVKFIDADNAVLSAGSDISSPARPFIRQNLYPENCDRLAKALEMKLEQQLKFGSMADPDKATYKTLDFLGKRTVVLQRDKASSGGFDTASNNTYKDQEHNSEITQKIKGYDKPLFETGSMISALNSKVERRGI